jgi:hypothetical protein
VLSHVAHNVFMITNLNMLYLLTLCTLYNMFYFYVYIIQICVYNLDFTAVVPDVTEFFSVKH